MWKESTDIKIRAPDFMKIQSYTLELTEGEMYDMAYAVMDSIEMRLADEVERNWKPLLEDFESELELLQTFTGRGYGFSLTVDKRVVGQKGTSHWEPNPKTYHDAEEWFGALLKQRKKEYEQAKNITAE